MVLGFGKKKGDRASEALRQAMQVLAREVYKKDTKEKKHALDVIAKMDVKQLRSMVKVDHDGIAQYVRKMQERDAREASQNKKP